MKVVSQLCYYDIVINRKKKKKIFPTHSPYLSHQTIFGETNFFSRTFHPPQNIFIRNIGKIDVLDIDFAFLRNLSLLEIDFVNQTDLESLLQRAAYPPIKQPLKLDQRLEREISRKIFRKSLKQKNERRRII